MRKITLFILIGFTITLQGQNQLLSSIEENYFDSSWENSQGSNYEYDSNNNLIIETGVLWNITAWENSHKDNYTYDSNNKITESLYQYWNPNTQQFEDIYRSLYTYSSGNPTEIINQDYLGLQWENSYKTTITYTSINKIDMVFDYDWDGSQWVIEDRYTVTYNSNDKITQILGEEWMDPQWVNSDRELFTYDINNKISSTILEIWDGSNWNEEDRTDYILDASYNRTRETLFYNGDTQYKDEYAYDTSLVMSSFAHPFKDKTGLDYIYEDFPYTNKILSSNEFSYDISTSSFVNDVRITYNYTSSITLNTEQFEINSNALKVFPNPTSNIINIKLLNYEDTIASIYDLSGRLILKQNLDSEISIIDISSLSNGLYLLTVNADNKKTTKRILKK